MGSLRTMKKKELPEPQAREVKSIEPGPLTAVVNPPGYYMVGTPAQHQSSTVTYTNQASASTMYTYWVYDASTQTWGEVK